MSDARKPARQVEARRTGAARQRAGVIGSTATAAVDDTTRVRRAATTKAAALKAGTAASSDPALEASIDAGPFGAVSFSGNMLYWTRLLETSVNRAFVTATPEFASVSVWRVLAWLSEKESLTVGELATHTHMERTVLGRLLDRMAELGLLARAPAADDRRISRARITAKGRRLLARIQPIRDAIYAQATRGIDSAEIEAARRVIVRMVRNLNPAAEDETRGT